MTSSIHNLTIHLSSDTIQRLERIARERGETSEELAALLLEQSIHTKGTDTTIRVVQGERRESEISDPKGLMEIIKRQDLEIKWLRDKISRLITLNPPIHVIHHSQDGKVWQESKNSLNTTADSGLQPQENRSEESRKEEQAYNPPPQIAEDFSMDNFNQTVEAPSDSQDLLTQSCDENISDEHQVSGRTLRDLVGGITGEKNYSLSEAAAIAGEAESILMEYINDGFLQAVQYQDTYLIRGNALRNYILSK